MNFADDEDIQDLPGSANFREALDNREQGEDVEPEAVKEVVFDNKFPYFD